MRSSNNMSKEKIRGCLLGGAVGDALGAPVEFDSLEAIRQEHGPQGLLDYAPAYGRLGAITDDTQMSLFTLEGLIRARVREATKGVSNAVSVVHHSYLRWLLTQHEPPAQGLKIGTDGWLFAVEGLHYRRAPGVTCIAALRASTGFGDPRIAANNSKGCGGVMRVAPVGLIQGQLGSYQDVFALGADVAALTHGHPSGYLAAGYFALLIAALTRGKKLERAIEIADRELANRPGSQEVARSIRAARQLAARGAPSPEDLQTLGAGWVAEEALAIAVCCALTTDSFSHGVRMSVNHSGDSDSTGAMAGNLLGVMMGTDAIPPHWLDALELREEITSLADDFYLLEAGAIRAEEMWERYPGW